MKNLKIPFDRKELEELKAGEMVTLTGTLYTGRDAVHKRWMSRLDRGEDLGFPIENACIYYVGPTPSKEGEPIGSCGPTSSYRMDDFTPRLLDLGLAGMIGKGRRSPEVIESIKKNKAVYFTAIGGSAAKLKASVVSCEIIDYPDLGAEAVRHLEVKDFPVTVTIDSKGNNLYELGKDAYLNSLKEADK